MPQNNEKVSLSSSERQEYEAVAVAVDESLDATDNDGAVATSAKTEDVLAASSDDEDDGSRTFFGRLWREWAIIFILGWPTSINQLLQFLPGLFMLGFLPTEDDLAGAGMGFMVGNVTGISILIGFSTGMSTLAAQAYGAGNRVRAANLLQRQCLLHLVATCVPSSSFVE